MSRYIERQEYMDKMIALKDKEVIKIITGIRRCGKSTLMEMFQEHLLANSVVPERIIKINLEDFQYRKLLNAEALHQYVLDKMQDGGMNYLFLDEIQNVEEFPVVLNSLHLRPNLDIYVTGSNAYMLSSEIATFISGRYVEIKMLPLSFKEFVSTSEDKSNLQNLYRRYIEIGSFPGALKFVDQLPELKDYLEAIYNTVVLKDVIYRKNINDPLILQSIVRFVFDNIGSELSSKKIADTMTSEGRKIDSRTVEKYLNALMESFIIYQARRYNIKGRQYLRTNEKYYAVDMAMRRVLLGNRAMDVGHILENIVYLELIRRGYEVYVGKIDSLEVDFVAVDSQTIIYVQIAATVREENTLERELKSLRKIKDSHPKLLLTLDDDPVADYEGIKRINVLDWLLGYNILL